MYDMGVYTLNAARYTTGEEAVAIAARHPRTAVVTDDGNTRGFTRSDGDLMLNGAQIDLNQTTQVFADPGYPFTVEPPANGLAQRVRDHASPRTTLCHPPGA
jgi:hypothetical protein